MDSIDHTWIYVMQNNEEAVRSFFNELDILKQQAMNACIVAKDIDDVHRQQMKYESVTELESRVKNTMSEFKRELRDVSKG